MLETEKHPSVQREKADHSQILKIINSFRLETGSNILKFWKKSYFQPRILYPTKNPVKCVGRN